MEDTTIEDVLKTVEKLYSQKNYSGALQLLEKSSNKIGEGLWHYNMGTVLGKLEKLPEARYHLSMSERHGFHSKELSLNQEIVESKLGVSKYEKPLTLTDYLARGGLIGGQGYFTTLALFFLVIAIWILRKKDRFKSSLLYLTFSVIFVGLNFWVNRWDQSIVVAPKVIHDGPSSLFGERGELPLGVMLITTENEDWIKIIYPSRFEGWIKRDGLKELR